MTEAPHSLARRWRIPRRLTSILLGLVIFVCGGVVGGSAAALYIRARVLDAIHSPEVHEGRVLNRIDKLLGLRDEQRAAVERIFREHQQELTALRDSFFPRLDTHLQELRNDIAEVLDAEQQERWKGAFEHLRQTYIPDNYRGD